MAHEVNQQKGYIADMRTNVNYTAVGSFVIGLSAVIILMVIWLSSGISFEKYTIYQVYMKEAITGLSLDAEVEFNGVNVGTVSDIEIDHRNPHLVSLLLKVKSDTPVTLGTKAKLDVRALSGTAIILLEDNGSNLRPLRALRGQRYPVINTAPSLLFRIDTAITQISQSFHRLSDSLETLLDNQNLLMIKQSLINLRNITNTLSVHSNKMALILDNTAKSTNTLSTQTLPDTNQLLNNLNAAAQNLNSLTSEVKQNPSIILRGKEPPPLGPGEHE